MNTIVVYAKYEISANVDGAWRRCAARTHLTVCWLFDWQRKESKNSKHLLCVHSDCCDVMCCAAADLHLKRTLNRKYENHHTLTHSKTFPCSWIHAFKLKEKFACAPRFNYTKINTKKTSTVLLDAHTNDFFRRFTLPRSVAVHFSSLFPSFECPFLYTLFQRMIALLCSYILLQFSNL